jgi:hypothetical protein
MVRGPVHDDLLARDAALSGLCRRAAETTVSHEIELRHIHIVPEPGINHETDGEMPCWCNPQVEVFKCPDCDEVAGAVLIHKDPN